MSSSRKPRPAITAAPVQAPPEEAAAPRNFFDVSLAGAIVDRLREGSGDAVERLALVGVRPGMTLQHEDPVGDGNPQTHTLWNWSHWSDQPGAVEAWAPYVDAACIGVPATATCWRDAVEGSTHSPNAVPLAASWKILEETGKRCGYARASMVAALMNQVVSADTDAASASCLLRGLAAAGILLPSDVSAEARLRWPTNPLLHVAAHPDGKEELLDTLLAMVQPTDDELDAMVKRLLPFIPSQSTVLSRPRLVAAARLAPLLEPEQRAALLEAASAATVCRESQALRMLLSNAPDASASPRRTRRRS